MFLFLRSNKRIVDAALCPNRLFDQLNSRFRKRKFGPETHPSRQPDTSLFLCCPLLDLEENVLFSINLWLTLDPRPSIQRVRDSKETHSYLWHQLTLRFWNRSLREKVTGRNKKSQKSIFQGPFLSPCDRRPLLLNWILLLLLLDLAAVPKYPSKKKMNQR